MKKILFFCIALILGCATVVAQTVVKGKVLDEDRNVVIGATVEVVGTKTAVISNIDGEFTIEIPKKKSKLRARYVGFDDATVDAKQGVEIILKEPVVVEPRKERRYIKLSDSDRKFIGDVNDFTFRMMREVYNNKSCVASPLSVACLLAMTSNGAAGKTLSEMQTLLGSSPAELNSFYKRIIPYLTDSQWGSAFSMANALFTNMQFKLNDTFTTEASDNYQAMVKSLNFLNSSPLKEVNDWCKRQTNGMIPKIIDKTNPLVLMYALNAVYFESKWKYEFDESNTKDEKFHLTDAKTKTVPMMHQEREIYYAKTDNCAMLMLPYQGETSYEMIVLLPDKAYSVEKMLADFDYNSWREAWNGRFTCKVDVKLPRFDIDTEQPLNALMSKMGMPTAFDEEFADFSRMTDLSKLPKGINLCISEMKQKARIEVKEKGTKAAAVTMEEVVVTGTGLRPQKKPNFVNFHADRPFAYMIAEHSTGLILFMGVYNGE